MQELVTDQATNTAQHIKVQGLEISIAFLQSSENNVILKSLLMALLA